mgnify:CR=1 FL=1
MKFSSSKATVRGAVVTTFYVNGLEVATCAVGRDSYCTTKNGVPSNIRNQTKRCVRASWNRSNLATLGVTNPPRISGPDLKWGYTGEAITMKMVKELFTPAAVAA